MKILITGGCSFSECITPTISTWPKHLANALPEYTHISTAMGSQGNGLISRRIIYEVSKQLETTDPDDIAVGVMWSGPDRHDFYRTTTDVRLDKFDGWIENPTRFIPKSPGSWVILNHHWSNHYAKTYYKTFHDYIGQLIYSIEHILRTQWFLQSKGIKYFMSTYTGEVFPTNGELDLPEIKYLYDQIEKEFFLPVVGEYEWCRDYSKFDFPVPGDNHPGTEQHKDFTERVILPSIKGYIE